MTREEMRENIRVNLINLRIARGMNQTEVGKKVNKVKTAVASWEQGVSLPDITTLYQLSKFYGVTMEYFYEDHEEEGEI
jgi:transcriptional regulator with XRE-family HTH domain